MNERERGICSRFKELRERFGGSQWLFAALLHLTHNRLASLEYRRTPLRADTAIRLARLTGCNLFWLAEGDGQIFGGMPSGADIQKIPPRSLFSEAWENCLKSGLHPGAKQFDDGGVSDDIVGGASAASYCEEEIQGVLKCLPPRLHWNFYSALSGMCRKFIQSNQAKIVDSGAAKATCVQNIARNGLTSISLKGKNSPMKSEVAKLIARLKHQTRKAGAKSELARFLDVAPARVSEWLSGDKEPGGEYTLRLLYWVEQQERQK